MVPPGYEALRRGDKFQRGMSLGWSWRRAIQIIASLTWMHVMESDNMSVEPRPLFPITFICKKACPSGPISNFW